MRETVSGAREGPLAWAATARRLGQTQALWWSLPALTVVAAVLLYPTLLVVNMSFRDLDLLRPDRAGSFVGLKHFVDLWTSSDFWYSIWVAVLYTGGTTAGSYIAVQGGALLAHRKFVGRGVARVAMILPWVFPPVVTGLVWVWMYDYQFGVFNYLLQRLNFVKAPIPWLTSPSTALLSVTLTTIWKDFPLVMLMLLAALQSIPREQYEAASIDGANGLQQFRYVTLPGIRDVSATVVLLLSVWTFRSSAYIYVMTGGGPARSTEVVGLSAYLYAFRQKDFGYASAIGVYVLLILLVFSVLYMRLLSREAPGA